MSTTATTTASVCTRAGAPPLHSSFTWTIAGNVTYSLCQWGMLSVLAKTGTPVVVGQFALGLAVAAPVFMFTNLQLRGVQATDAQSNFEFADYFTLRIVATSAGLIAVLAILLALRCEATTAGVILLVAAAKAVETLSDVIAGLLQRHERLDQVAVGLMIRGVLSVSAFGIVFLRTRNLIAAVGALACAWLVVLLGYDFRCARVIQRNERPFVQFRCRALARLTSISIPLGLVMTLISLNVNIPRYFLARYLGPADLGIFASLAYLLVAMNLVVSALGQSATTRLAEMFASGNLTGFRNLLGRLLIIGVAMLFLGVPASWLFGRQVLSIIYQPEYAMHLPLFMIMVAAGGVTSIGSFLGYGMTAAHCFRSQVPIIASSTLTTALLSYLLIPRFGSLGAAAALGTSSLVMCFGSASVLLGAMRQRSA